MPRGARDAKTEVKNSFCVTDATCSLPEELMYLRIQEFNNSPKKSEQEKLGTYQLSPLPPPHKHVQTKGPRRLNNERLSV